MIAARERFIEAQTAMLKRFSVTARSHFVETTIIRGQAQVLEAGEGPPVVLVSGIGTPAAMWAPLLAQLHGLHLYAVDLPGYGLTDTIPDFTDNFRANTGAFLTSVLDRLALDRPCFVANSLGSLWTSWLALDHPERVAAMVHIGCPAIVQETSAPLPMRLLSVRGLGRLMMRLQPPSRKQVIELSKMVHEHPMIPELIDLLVATERLPQFKDIFLATLHKLVRLGGNRRAMRLSTEQLGQMQQPALLFFGKDDPMGAEAAGKQMAAAMPNAELRVVEGGHAPWLKQAETIGPVAREFLKKHAG